MHQYHRIFKNALICINRMKEGHAGTMLLYMKLTIAKNRKIPGLFNWIINIECTTIINYYLLSFLSLHSRWKGHIW